MYKTLVTDAGAAALNAAIANNANYPITQMAVGDGGGSPITPSATATALTNELYRASLSLLAQHPERPNQLIAEFPAPAAYLEGETLREAGLFDGNGTLFAICNLPEIVFPPASEGASRDAMIRMIFEVTNADDITLIIDPNVVYATQQWVMENSSAAAMIDGPTEVYPGQTVQYQITNYHAFYDYSVSVAGPNSAAVVGDTIVLNVDAAASGSIDLGITCRGYYREVTIGVLSQAVIKPVITAPANGEEVSKYPELTSSAFACYPTGADSHSQSQWQIATDPAFSNIAEDITSGTDLTSLSGIELTLGQTYYARVRHQGASIGWSAWSTAVSFTAAGSDWLLWDGANDGPDIELLDDGNAAVQKVYEVQVINDTDFLAFAANTIFYVRRYGITLEVVGTTSISSHLAGEAYDTPAVIKSFRRYDGSYILFWTDKTNREVRYQYYTFNTVMGSVEFLNAPQTLFTGLAYDGASTGYEEILRDVIWLDDHRFVIITGEVNLRANRVGLTPRIAGYYIDPADGTIYAGNALNLGSNCFSVGAVLVNGKIVTAEQSGYAITFRVFSMPGITLSQKSTSTFSSVESRGAGTQSSQYRPYVDMIRVADNKIIIASSSYTQDSSGAQRTFLFFVGCELVENDITGISYYIDNVYSGLNTPSLLVNNYGINAGHLFLYSVDGTAFFKAAKSMMKIYFSGGSIYADYFEYQGANHFNEQSAGDAIRFRPKKMTDSLLVSHVPVDSTWLMNGEV